MKKIICIIFLLTGLSACTQFEKLTRELQNLQGDAVAGPSEKEISIARPTSRIYTGEVMGQMENIGVDTTPLTLKAKLDTSLSTTVLDTKIIRTVKEDDREFIVYSIQSEEVGRKEFKKEIIRWESAKKQSGNTALRPVVVMELCIGKERINAEVSLANNEHFLYPLLIGNNVLRNRIIVDTTKSFTIPPQCGEGQVPLSVR